MPYIKHVSFIDDNGQEAPSPEVRLLRKMIARAILDMRSHPRKAYTKKNQLLRWVVKVRSAYAWIISEDDVPWSSAWVFAQANIPHSSLRKFRKWAERQMERATTEGQIALQRITANQSVSNHG